MFLDVPGTKFALKYTANPVVLLPPIKINMKTGVYRWFYQACSFQFNQFASPMLLQFSRSIPNH
jgi:hypothetical protein